MVNIMRTHLRVTGITAFLFLITVTYHVHAATFSLDEAFGTDGVATIGIAEMGLTGDVVVSSVYQKSTGEILVTGYETSTSPTKAFLLQLEEDGTPDDGYGVAGYVNLDFGASTQSLGFVPFGNNAFISGFYVDDSDDEGGFISYFDASGNLVPGFNSGIVLRAQDDLSFPATLVSDGGQTFVFAYDATAGTSSIIAYDGSGIYTGFGTNGVFNLGEGRVRDAKLSDGDMVLVMDGPSTGSSVLVKRVTQAGTYDSAFGISGSVSLAFAADSTPRGMTIAISPDGKIAVGGSYALSSFINRYAYVYVLNSDGTLDASFSEDGLIFVASGVSDDEVTSATYDDEGVLFVTGTLNGTSGNIYAYDTDGTVQSEYSGGVFAPDEVAGGASRLYFDDGVLIQAYPSGDQSQVIVSRYVLDFDQDDDGVDDDIDNCPAVSNADQDDRDEDLIGNACDADYISSGRSGSMSQKEVILRALKRYIREGDSVGLESYVRRYESQIIRYRDTGTIFPKEALALLTSTQVSETSSQVSETSFVPVTPMSLVQTVRDLELGIEGQDVMFLQKLLIQAAAGESARELVRVGATGYFGRYTQNALSEYQRMHDISPVSGYFGPITREKMKVMGLQGIWW